MAYKSGSDFDAHYDGSIGTDGNVRNSDSGGGWHSVNDTHFKTLDDGTELISRSKGSKNDRNFDHAHFHNHHGSGKRGNSVKKPHKSSTGKKQGHKVNKNNECDLFDAFAKFLGF